MDIFKILLAIHVTGGFISFALGAIILTLKKGDKRHKLLGKIYFYAMLTAALVSLPMAYLHTNYFLFIVGIFTAYMLLTGTRYLQKKTIDDVKSADWLLSGIMLVFALCFVGFGCYLLFGTNNFGIVLLVFGFISIFFVMADYKNYKGQSTIKNYWLTTHIQRMIGSYIASTTAFLVVNNTYLPSVVAWLLPTIIITPLIVKWTRKYKVLLK